MQNTHIKAAWVIESLHALMTGMSAKLTGPVCGCRPPAHTHTHTHTHIHTHTYRHITARVLAACLEDGDVSQVDRARVWLQAPLHLAVAVLAGVLVVRDRAWVVAPVHVRKKPALHGRLVHRHPACVRVCVCV